MRPTASFECKPVKPLGSGVPELDRPIETPREHRLIGQHEQISQTFCAFHP